MNSNIPFTTMDKHYCLFFDHNGADRLLGRVYISTNCYIGHVFYESRSEYKKELRKLKKFGFDIRSAKKIKSPTTVSDVFDRSFIQIYKLERLWNCQTCLPIENSQFSMVYDHSDEHLTDIVTWLSTLTIPVNSQVVVCSGGKRVEFVYDNSGMTAMLLACS